MLLFSICNAISQEKEYTFKNYTQEEGLPSNETYFILKDSKHYLWIATDKGVVRYNGNKIENFELPDPVVFKIVEDVKGRIWFLSYKGKISYYYNGKIMSGLTPYKTEHFSNLLLSSLGFFRYFLPK